MSIECPICFEECESYIKLSCNHKFHEKCIKDWVKKSTECPMCRKFLGYFTLENSNSLLPHFNELYKLETKE